MPTRKTPSPVRINSAKRAIAVTDQVSACLVTGTDKLQSGFGNGDCLLVDFQNLFFAVADGSERWPSASQDFLRRLANALSSGYRPKKKDEWLELVNTIYARQSYIHKTTFSGVAISGEIGRKVVYIIHGGDSLILLLNLRTGRADYHTCADMNFAGRIKELSYVTRIPLGAAPYRLIIASDGLADVARLLGQTIEEMCINAVFRFPVHEVPDRLDRFFLERKRGLRYDDIGIITLDPERISRDNGLCFLIGGTSPQEEGLFQEEKGSSRVHDTWIDVSRCDSASDELRIAGIRVMERELEVPSHETNKRERTAPDDQRKSRIQSS